MDSKSPLDGRTVAVTGGSYTQEIDNAQSGPSLGLARWLWREGSGLTAEPIRRGVVDWPSGSGRETDLPVVLSDYSTFVMIDSDASITLTQVDTGRALDGEQREQTGFCFILT
ncbi:hypothetical protein [Salinigranum marinum]|uniref:hypothetical protein n=1 Tax=Salinigranum marinum TaxID=1515595 RepID=UPI002989BBD5|nr:hypothetical protein [Salinigranum marinum]